MEEKGRVGVVDRQNKYEIAVFTILKSWVAWRRIHVPSIYVRILDRFGMSSRMESLKTAARTQMPPASAAGTFTSLQDSSVRSVQRISTKWRGSWEQF